MKQQSAWTPQRLVGLSQDLANAFYPAASDSRLPQRSRGWTAERFRDLGETLAQAYGPGL